MTYTIKNEFLTAKIKQRGGMLSSLIDQDDNEYIWQRDPKYWDLSDINIFPYVARLTKDTYYYNKNKYHMGIHGFLWQSNLQIMSISDKQITFRLISSAQTLQQYPFCFELQLKRELVGKKLKTTYTVINKELKKKMYFGLGGHPAFNVPINPQLKFTDYFLHFNDTEMPQQVDMSSDCFVLGTKTPFPLDNDHNLLLKHKLFDNDAIILQDVGKQVNLQSRKDKRAIKLFFPQMKYLGVWHTPHTEANYVCIEPWSSLPARKNIIDDLAKKNDLIALNAGERYQNTWEITVVN